MRCWHLICKWIPKVFESALMATRRVLTLCRSAEFAHSIKAEHNTTEAKLSIFHSCSFTDNTAVVCFKTTPMFPFYSHHRMTLIICLFFERDTSRTKYEDGQLCFSPEDKTLFLFERKKKCYF